MSRKAATPAKPPPPAMQQAADCASPVFQETVERMMKYDERFRQNSIARVRATGASETELGEFIKFLDEANFPVKPTREFAIANSLSVIDIVVEQLAKMRWEFAEVPLQTAT